MTRDPIKETGGPDSVTESLIYVFLLFISHIDPYEHLGSMDGPHEPGGQAGGDAALKSRKTLFVVE